MYKSLLVLLFCVGSTIVSAKSLVIVNGTGNNLLIHGYAASFNDCFIPEDKTKQYWNGTDYNLPVAKPAYFTLDENKPNCNSNEILFSILNSGSSSFLGYTATEPLESRISYKVVGRNAYIYPSQDLFHSDGIVLNIGHN